MNMNRLCAFALVGVLALTGCVSVEKTREQIKSSNKEEVKKGEDTIYWAATVGRDAAGFVNLTIQERVEYVNLTSNPRLLLKIVDNSNDGNIIAAAIDRIDFSKDGIAQEFVVNCFNKIEIIKNYNRNGNEISNRLRKKIITNLTQDELLNLVTNSQKLSHDDHHILMNRLIEITDSIDILWKIRSEKNWAEHHYGAEYKLLKVLDQVTDTKMAEELLAAHSVGGGLLVEKADQRLLLIRRLPEGKIVRLVLSGIKDHNVYKWNNGDSAALELGIGVMSSIKDTKAIAKITSAILGKVAEYRKACSDSWTMSWDAQDDERVKKLIEKLPKLSDDTLIALVSLDGTSWKYFMPSVTSDVAYKVLVHGKAKSAELEEALVQKLPADKVDMNVYNGVKTDAGKKAVLVAMPAELKKSAQETAKKAFASVLEKAKAAAKETFELHGFYLGMDWEDMKQVLSNHFPDYTITERRDGDEKDADYVVYIPKQSTPFCYASAKDKKVYQFNFGKVILKKWYKYDIQTFMEWARKYSREMGIDMRFKTIEKDTTVYEPMDMSRSYKVWFHQESYQYKHNAKGYRLIYFGEEKDFTFESGIGGAIIKEMAAPRFRYVRGDPGSLRVSVEND